MPAGRTIRCALAVALAVLPLAACAAPDASGGPGADDSVTGRVVVLAAASLTETFDELAAEFEAEHPGVDVVISYGGSSALAEQIIAGAPVALFAAASPTTMQTVVDAGLTSTDPVVFARNALEIAVPPGNPAQITGLADLADPARTIALCDVAVPCGAAAQQAFEQAGLTPAPDTYEPDVRAVLTKVRLGEVDAGVVYRTDVLAAAGAVEGIALAESEQVTSDDLVAAIDPLGSEEAAQAFLAFLLSDRARQVLLDAGFAAP